MNVFFSIFWWVYFFVFFSGYPLAFGLIYFLNKSKNQFRKITEKIYPVMPLVYAFVATAFWILMICTGRMDFVAQKIASVTPSLFAILYSFTSLLFWLPVFRKNLYLSLLHSLPLSLLPILYMLANTFRHKVTTHDYISNLFLIYFVSFAVHMIAIAFLLIIKWLLSTRFFFKHYKA